METRAATRALPWLDAGGNASRFSALVRLLDREAGKVIAVSFVLVMLTLVPDALGFTLARPGTAFMGTLMNPEDTNSYLAKMQQGYEGNWLYSIPFTSEPHSAEFLGGFYLALGHFARFSGLSILQTWYVARVAFAFLMFVVACAFIRSYLLNSRTRLIAYAFALTGSGLGWLLFAAGQTYWLGDFPVDFKMPEAHLFFSAMTFPHFSTGVVLILISLWLSMRSIRGEGVWYAVGAGAANLALAVVYPFLIYLIAAVTLLWLLNQFVQSKRILLRPIISAAISVLIPSPLLVYYFVVLRSNPIFAAWDAQAATPSPNPLHFLAAYGALLILAAPTLLDRSLRPLWLWVFAAAVLLYMPLNAQRRFVEGIQVPLSILASAGVVSYYLPKLDVMKVFRRLANRPGYSARGLQKLIVLSTVVLLSVSNLYVFLSMNLTAAVEQPYPFFRSLAELEALSWAAATLPAGSVIMSGYETGSLIPTRSNLRTVIGHWAETPQFAAKYNQVNSFFSGHVSKQGETALLKSARVNYIFYGPEERSLGGYDPGSDVMMAQVYVNSSVVIFRVSE